MNQKIVWGCKHNFKDKKAMNKWRVNIGHSWQGCEKKNAKTVAVKCIWDK